MEIGRRERKKLELHERIVDAAGALIGRQGLAQTTVDQIAEACDIAQATFFNHFASKGALIDTLVGRLAETFNGVFEGVPGTALDGVRGDPAVSKVELLFGFTAALRPEEQRFVRDILVESARSWSPATIEAMSRTRDLFIADIAAGQGRGDVRADRECRRPRRRRPRPVLLGHVVLDGRGRRTLLTPGSTPPGGWSSTCWRSRKPG